MHVRPATEADRDAVWAMLEPVFRAGDCYCMPRDISRGDALDFWFAPAHAVFVAAESEAGQPLGTSFLRPNKKGGGAHVCNAAYVTAPAEQGRGVGRALLDHSLEEARRRGYLAMQFSAVVAVNARAVALWRQNGFETVGRIPDGFRLPDGGFSDLLVMHRGL